MRAPSSQNYGQATRELRPAASGLRPSVPTIYGRCCPQLRAMPYEYWLSLVNERNVGPSAFIAVFLDCFFLAMLDAGLRMRCMHFLCFAPQRNSFRAPSSIIFAHEKKHFGPPDEFAFEFHFPPSFGSCLHVERGFGARRHQQIFFICSKFFLGEESMRRMSFFVLFDTCSEKFH